MERDRGRASTPPRPEDAAYVTALQAAGLKDLNADDVLALKNQGVTADYARDLTANGIAPRVRTLIAFKAQGIDSAYVKEIRAAGLEPSANQILAFKAQGIDTAFIKDLRAAGQKLFEHPSAARWPARRLPANNQFERPKATGRIWFSIQLLSAGNCGSSTKRVSAVHRLRL